MSMQVILPTEALNQAKKLVVAIETGMDAAAEAALIDFHVTTETWSHQPRFTIDKSHPGERIIGTDDDIYHFVDAGTKPHTIVAKNKKVLAFGAGSRAKTQVRVIGSGAGRKGGTPVRVTRVRHPGTAARQFSETIAAKWQDELPATVQRAIDNVFGG